MYVLYFILGILSSLVLYLAFDKEFRITIPTMGILSKIKISKNIVLGIILVAVAFLWIGIGNVFGISKDIIYAIIGLESGIVIGIEIKIF